MQYLAVFTEEKSGKYSVTIPALPGCFSEGDNFEDAKKNIKEAVELYMENEDFSENFSQEPQFMAPIEVSFKK